MMREIMNTKEAADFLRMAPGTLENMRVYGTGPRYSKRCGVTYHIDDLRAWRAEGNVVAYPKK